MARFGWRPFFIVLGLATMLWLLPWLVWMPRGPGLGASTSSENSPGMWEIVERPSVWGTCGGLFTLNFLFYFMINWLPTYLVQERRFSMDRVATVGFAYLIAAVMSPIAGWLSDRWISAGATPTLVRKSFMIGGQAGCAAALFGCVVAGPDVAFLLLLVAGLAFGFSNSQTWAITQTLAGPNASGKWTGIQNFAGNWAGILGPIVTGFIIERSGGFFWAFTITVAVGLLGCLCWVWVVGPVAQVPWKAAASLSQPPGSAASG
jgi:MFS family permease